MRKWMIAAICIVVLVRMGVYAYTNRTVHIEFPFEASEVEQMELYCIGAYYSGRDASETKYLTDGNKIQSYYEMFSTMDLKIIKSEYEYDPYVEVVYQFDLKNGQQYPVIFRGYGIKKGIFRLPDQTLYFSIGDYGGVWMNLYERLE